jgi:hypothetical protein
MLTQYIHPHICTYILGLYIDYWTDNNVLRDVDERFWTPRKNHLISFETYNRKTRKFYGTRISMKTTKLLCFSKSYNIDEDGNNYIELAHSKHNGPSVYRRYSKDGNYTHLKIFYKIYSILYCNILCSTNDGKTILECYLREDNKEWNTLYFSESDDNSYKIQNLIYEGRLAEKGLSTVYYTDNFNKIYCSVSYSCNNKVCETIYKINNNFYGCEYTYKDYNTYVCSEIMVIKYKKDISFEEIYDDKIQEIYTITSDGIRNRCELSGGHRIYETHGFITYFTNIHKIIDDYNILNRSTYQ